MNNQAAQTMPWIQERELIRAALCKELDTNIESDERTYTIAVRAANALHWRQIEIDQLKAQVAALSQTAGVAEGFVMVPMEPTPQMVTAGFMAREKQYAPEPLDDFVASSRAIYHAMLAAAPAASDGESHPDALPDGTLSKSTAKRVEAQSSNPNPVTPGLSSESGASVSERARVSLDLNNLPAEWPWDEGSPCLGPRPVGMVYPAVPTPRAFGYLDKSGVEWAAYDTGQMEEYGRRAFSDGANTVLCALEQALTQQRGEEPVPAIVREVLEWYASDPSIWVGWTKEGWAEEEAAKKSGHYRFIGEDNRGHNEYVPNHVRAEEALAAYDEWQERLTTTPQPGAEALREKHDG